MDSRIEIAIDPPASGHDNMAEDRRLLERVEGLESPRTLVRFYGWSRPTVSLGRFQDPLRAVDLDYCRRQGIDWVTRPTGGRAVLHDNELTYAVASNDGSIFPLESVHGTYSQIAQLLSQALECLGLTVTIEQRPLRQRRRDEMMAPCFAAVARSEILCRGRKLVGSAQRRLQRSFLQHGSIPVDLDYEKQGRALRFDPRELRRTVTCVSECCERDISSHEMATVFSSAFECSLRSLSDRGGTRRTGTESDAASPSGSFEERGPI